MPTTTTTSTAPIPLCPCKALPSPHTSGLDLCRGEGLPTYPLCLDCGGQRVTYFKPDPTARPGTVSATYRFECDACHSTQIAHDLDNPTRRLIGPRMNRSNK